MMEAVIPKPAFAPPRFIRGGWRTYQYLGLATPIGFEPTISTVTGWHVNRYTTGPRNIILFAVQEGCQRGSVRRRWP